MNVSVMLCEVTQEHAIYGYRIDKTDGDMGYVKLYFHDGSYEVPVLAVSETGRGDGAALALRCMQHFLKKGYFPLEWNSLLL